MSSVEKINLAQKYASFDDRWSPKIVGELDDYHIKLVKIQGDFVWHKHDDVDELFLVMNGQFTMKLRDGDVVVEQGEFIIIPAGVEHCPSAVDECQVMLFEKAGTLNTGDSNSSDMTVQELDRI